MIKYLRKYKIYMMIMVGGVVLFLYAELPVMHFPMYICNIFTNKIVNDLCLALGTGMLGSSLTALLIDRVHEKQAAIISCNKKRQVLYEMLLNLRFWLNLDDPVWIFEKALDSAYVGERIAECQRFLNCAIPFVSPEEYNAISTIEIQLKSIEETMQKLTVKENYSLYQKAFECLLYSNDPIMQDSGGILKGESELIDSFKFSVSLANEISSAIVLNNMRMKYIKKQLQLFDDIETEDAE